VIRRLVTAIVVAAACVAAVVATAASEGDEGKAYKVVFDNAFGLTEGGDFRMGGVRAGRTTGFGLTQTDPVRSVVSFEITQPGFDSLRTDTFCQIRQQSLIGEYYVDCQPGTDEEELPEGATIPVEQTAGIIPVDLVQNTLREPYSQRLRLIINELGTGLAGRPDDLSEALRRAHPGLRETSETLRILGRQKQILQDFVTNSDTVLAELAANRSNVGRFVREAAETAEISASRHSELASGFQKLPGFLQQLTPYMVSLEGVVDEQLPLLADLRHASGDLNRFFTRLGPFAQATRPALRTLSDAADVGKGALERTTGAVRNLADLSVDARKTGKPLRQFLVSLDDRKRATMHDPRAGQTAPPKPDPTAKKPNRGFTGFEAFINYAFWQTLAINGFDELSHFLRIYGVVDDCSRWSVDPSRHELEKCSTFLGPYQPGIREATGTINGHDFGKFDSGNISDFGASKRNRKLGGSKGASNKKAKKSSVDEAFSAPGGPKAAGRDSSQPGAPQAAEPGGLDDQVRGLVDGLTRALNPRKQPSEPQPRQAPEQQDSGGSGKLLDFLLGP
jgi:phospholipid/cholesterol/gamma-HCH transport system substrate-binding protein